MNFGCISSTNEMPRANPCMSAQGLVLSLLLDGSSVIESLRHCLAGKPADITTESKHCI
jgi:hypothetical protein